MLIRRFSAALVSLMLVAGSGAVCAGWATTAEERMDCCVDGSCPMHRRERDANKVSVTQAQADSCCASSEDVPAGETKAPFGTSVVAASLDSGILLSVAVYTPLHDGAWDSPPPLHPDAVPKHVLFSVYLV